LQQVLVNWEVNHFSILTEHIATGPKYHYSSLNCL